ncbi:MAG: LUD domain-containing protein [Deltaproteobacteria bacterium]|nr:LUD domain-containing protein [Deltaproteobacteria bacterium]
MDHKPPSRGRLDRRPRDFHGSLREALADSFLRETLDRFADQYKANRAAVFEGLPERELIARVSAMKDGALGRIEELYGDFAAKARAKGLIVHRAKTAAEAASLISDIATRAGAKNVIKSKSMTAEEIGLNEALAAAGCDVAETDLGEWIIQLRHEAPSHMVLPAIHLSRHQVAEEFQRVTKAPQDGDIGRLVKVARRELRPRFAQADMAVTGANFAVADSGTLGLCTNEGNARLALTLPRVRVSLLGLDKLVPTAADALSILRVLPRNATAQPITTYVSWLAGATPGQTAHAVFLDNGRTGLLADAKCREALRCVRCGACANVCPVYRFVGGHRMGYVYIGAIGLILTYFFHGKGRAEDLIGNCVGCEACKDVCAAGIDLTGIISEIRARISDANGAPATSTLLSLVMPNRRLFHGLLKLARLAQKPVTKGAYVRHLPAILSGDHGFKALPAMADRPFRDAWPEIEAQDLGPKAGPRVALMSGCAQDFVYPAHLEAAVRLIRAKGGRALFPMDQGCCGLPLTMMGERKAALRAARANLLAFSRAAGDYVTGLCPSCLNQMKNRYPALFADDPVLGPLAQGLARRLMDFSSLLAGPLGYGPGDLSDSGLRVAYHSPCHLGRGLGVTGPPRRLVALAGRYLPTPGEDVCCGFGGTYSLRFPEISKALMDKKLDGLAASGADLLVTDCPGCVLQLGGGEEVRDKKIPVRHLSEFLALNLKTP